MEIELKHFKDILDLSKFHNIDIKHHLIDIIKYEDVNPEKMVKNAPFIFDFYKISFVRNFNGFIKIGETKFFGEKGALHFVEPGQVYTCNSTNPWTGYQILIHPDIFKEYFTHTKISVYDFFSYEASETLLLNQEEEKLVGNLMEVAWSEFNNGKDTFSIPIILSCISTLLNLTERFYARQFDTRKPLCNQIYSDFFGLLKTYYLDNTNLNIQQPSVQYFAKKLNITPNYLSDTIKHHSGKPALNIIHNFVIEVAKKQLATSHQTVSDISFQLGFEYPNYFSRLFKQKTKLSPTEYRKSVNNV